LAHDLQLVAMEPGRADRSPTAGESPRRGRRAHGRPGTLLRERGTRRRGGGPRGSPFDIRPADLLPRPQQLDQGPAPGICSSNAAMVTYLLSDLSVASQHAGHCLAGDSVFRPGRGDRLWSTCCLRATRHRDRRRIDDDKVFHSA
jgi:hypothetical protein